MAAKYNLECDMCKKKESFHDVHDITSTHWTILAWIVQDNRPLVVCSKCEYPVNKVTKKEIC